MRRFFAMVLCVAMFVPWALSQTEEPPKKKPIDEPKITAKKAAKPLDQTLSLTFSGGPTSAPEQTFTILCKTPDYHLSATAQKGQDAGQFEVDIKGSILPSENPGEYILTFEAKLGFKNATETAKISAGGSCSIKPGESKVVAKVGDKTLQVRVEAAP